MRQIQKSIAECIAPAEFVRVGPDDPVSAAVAKMLELSATSALVLEGDELVGIFTERDFLTRVAAEDKDPAATRVREIMTQPVETLREEDGVAYAINQMAEGGYRHIPIVDAEGRPISLLDVRLVMMHLVKVFAEIEEASDADPGDEWVDIGGG